MASQVNSTKCTKRIYTDPSQNLPNIEEKRALPKTLSELLSLVSLIPKPGKDITKKEN